MTVSKLLKEFRREAKMSVSQLRKHESKESSKKERVESRAFPKKELHEQRMKRYGKKFGIKGKPKSGDLIKELNKRKLPYIK